MFLNGSTNLLKNSLFQGEAFFGKIGRIHGFHNLNIGFSHFLAAGLKLPSFEYRILDLFQECSQECSIVGRKSRGRRRIQSAGYFRYL